MAAEKIERNSGRRAHSGRVFRFHRTPSIDPPYAAAFGCDGGIVCGGCLCCHSEPVLTLAWESVPRARRRGIPQSLPLLAKVTRRRQKKKKLSRRRQKETSKTSGPAGGLDLIKTFHYFSIVTPVFPTYIQGHSNFFQDGASIFAYFFSCFTGLLCASSWAYRDGNMARSRLYVRSWLSIHSPCSACSFSLSP